MKIIHAPVKHVSKREKAIFSHQSSLAEIH